jgi:hypothetical protein
LNIINLTNKIGEFTDECGKFNRSKKSVVKVPFWLYITLGYAVTLETIYVYVCITREEISSLTSCFKIFNDLTTAIKFSYEIN